MRMWIEVYKVRRRGDLMEIDYLEDLGLDGRSIFRWLLET